ncbi:MAG: ATP-dependent Clp protease proteolytic subunit [Eubacteriales bacterium]|nr:ATP-dependent Clp protease proteolytic subunit [Eubacteriales bacterium]
MQNNNDNQDKDKGRQGAEIKEYGQPLASPSPIHIVSIIGQIEGHMNLPPQNKTTKYEHILPQLVMIEQDPEVKGFILLMNTAGGDVEAGLALAEMIAGMEKPSVSLVLGGGHSIGITLAVSADYSYISPTASMTIHPIRMSGLVIGVPQTFDYFNKMQQRIINFVCAHSKIEEKEYRRLMMQTDEIANDCGTILVGKEVVDYGIIDEIGTIRVASQKIRSLAGI